VVLDRFSLGMTLIAADLGGAFSAVGERRRACGLGIHGELRQDALELDTMTGGATGVVALPSPASRTDVRTLDSRIRIEALLAREFGHLVI
jgi:hypothetical protein